MMQTSPSDDTFTFRVLLAYLGVYLIWGSTYLAIRVGVQTIPPALLAGTRFALAGALLVLFAKLNGHSMPGWRDMRDLSIVGLFLLVGGNLLVVWAEKTIPSGLTALLIGIYPVIIATMDSFMPRGQRLSTLGWLGTAIGIAGVIILVSPGIAATEGENLDPLGITALVLACILWGVGSLYGKYHHVEGNIFVNSGIQNLAPSVVAFGIAFGSGELHDIHVSTEGILALLYLVFFGSILGYTSYQYLLRHQPPAKVSTYAYINPIVAVFLGWLILDEPITARIVVAAVVILSGVAIVQASKMKRRYVNIKAQNSK